MTKKLISMLVIALLVCSLAVTVFAGGVDQNTAKSVNQFDNLGDNSGASTSFQNIIGAIITIVQIIGTGVAIIMLIVLAIKYISAAPGDKAEIKKHAVVYVVGAIVLFAATGILGIVKNFASNISAASNGG
jgi:hypothetical protein